MRTKPHLVSPLMVLLSADNTGHGTNERLSSEEIGRKKGNNSPIVNFLKKTKRECLEVCLPVEVSKVGLLGEFLLSPARKLLLPLFDRQVKRRLRRYC